MEALRAELPRTRRIEAAALAASFGVVRRLLLAASPAALGSGELAPPRRLVMRRYLEERLRDALLGRRLGDVGLSGGEGAAAQRDPTLAPTLLLER